MVAIYMEGGGNSKDTKGALRRGMEALLEPLKQKARAKSIRWKLVCCGSRDKAYRRFRNTLQDGDDSMVVLLVDAEEQVATTPVAHLQRRDRWDLVDIDANSVHLMVQTMEAWIVADADALRKYYGQGFNAGALPREENLERVGKRDLSDSLYRATHRTQKGAYHKIRHASDLLQRMNAEAVNARCLHFRLLIDQIGQMIDAA